MEANIFKYIIKSSEADWQDLLEEGVDTTGISVKILRFDQKQNRPTTFLLKFEAGASYPYHNHPGGEEAFVLKGEVFFNEARLSQGDFLHTPSGAKHAVKTETGCEILFVVPEEVEIIK